MLQPTSRPMVAFIEGLDRSDDLAAALSICDLSFQNNVSLKSLILSKLSSVSFSDYSKIAPSLNRLCRLNNYDVDLAASAVFFNWVIGDYKEANELGSKAVIRYGVTIQLLRNMVFLYLVSGNHEKLHWIFEQAKHSNIDTAYWQKFLFALQQGSPCVVRHPDSNLNFLFSISCFSTQSMEAALHHWQGKFCEENELSIIGKLCRNVNVLEIGCLVGNHTVYMMLEGKAKSITCVDIDNRSCMMTRFNCQLNMIPTNLVKIVHARAGRQNNKTDLASLNDFYLQDAERADYGFIKIDIDGGELEFFIESKEYLRAKRPIVFAEVQKPNLSKVYELFEDLQYSQKVIEVRDSGESNIIFFPF